MHSIEAVTAAVPAMSRRKRRRDDATSIDDDPAAATAVLAHALLNSIAVVRGGTDLLAGHHDRLPEAERREWYRRIDDHAELVADALERVAQGRLADALAVAERGAGGRRRSSVAVDDGPTVHR